MTGQPAADIFTKVVEINRTSLNSVIDGLISKHELRIANSDYSDNEIRQQAVSLFYQELSQFVADHLKTRF